MHNAQRKILVDSITRLLRRDAERNLQKILTRTHPADLASVLAEVGTQDARRLFSLIQDPDKRAETLAEAVPEVQRVILRVLEDAEITDILDNLYADDAAAVLKEIPEERAGRILESWKSEDSASIDSLLAYEEGTAGAIMSPDFFALTSMTTVSEAIATLQAVHEELEMAFYLYVVNEFGQLFGVCSLRQLVVSAPHQLLREICETDVISAETHDEQETVAKTVARYNILALPIVNESSILVGIVTVDDVIDVIREEATEDILRFAGTDLDAFDDDVTVLGSVRARMPWLLASFLAGTMSMLVIGRFQDAIETIAALAAFIPVTLGMGGNVGTQAATIMVRGLTLGRVPMGQISRVISREIAVGAVGGLFYAAALASMSWILFRQDAVGMPWHIAQLAMTVSLAVFCCMSFAAAIGATVPIVFQKLGVDPAVATNPIVTTTTDTVGVLLYFLIATLLLPI